jgi:hypothetical protein
MNRLFCIPLLICIAFVASCTGSNKSILKPDPPVSAIEKKIY